MHVANQETLANHSPCLEIRVGPYRQLFQVPPLRHGSLVPGSLLWILVVPGQDWSHVLFREEIDEDVSLLLFFVNFNSRAQMGQVGIKKGVGGHCIGGLTSGH